MNRALLLAPLLALLPFAFIGCASAPDAKTQVPSAQDATCDREVKTGSMMPTVRCRTAAQKEADQKSAENAADFVRGTNQVMQPGK